MLFLMQLKTAFNGVKVEFFALFKVKKVKYCVEEVNGCLPSVRLLLKSQM